MNRLSLTPSLKAEAKNKKENRVNYKKKKEKIDQAWRFLLENNSSIPVDVIDLMRDSAIGILLEQEHKERKKEKVRGFGGDTGKSWPR